MSAAIEGSNFRLVTDRERCNCCHDSACCCACSHYCPNTCRPDHRLHRLPTRQASKRENVRPLCIRIPNGTLCLPVSDHRHFLRRSRTRGTAGQQRPWVKALRYHWNERSASPRRPPPHLLLPALEAEAPGNRLLLVGNRLLPHSAVGWW